MLAAFAIPAGSAFASTATFVSPIGGATIAQGQTFKVDTTGLLGVGDVLISSSTDGGVTTQFQSHCKSDGTPMLYNPATNDTDIPCTSGAGVYKVNVNVGGWTNGPITFVALINDTGGHPLETITESVNIDNTVAPLVVTGFSPAASSTVSGSFMMSVTPSDQNNAITRAQYSTDGGATYAALAPDGSGHYAASIDTVATGIPNGTDALDVRVRLDDTAGNELTHDYFYTLQNPQAPTITPNTLVADKAQFRTAETQLEVGDLVEAYNMEATGFPAPTITYVWRFCPAGGGACYDRSGDSHGVLTIQSSDEGATLTLIAGATNASGTDSTTVGFGVIGPAYVDPTPTPTPAPVDPTPAPVDPTPAPPVTPPVVTPPLVTPPVAAPPVVTPPVATPPVVTPPAKKPVTKKKPKPTKVPKTVQPSVSTTPVASTPAAPKATAATTAKPTKKAPKTGHPILPKKPVTTATAPATTKPATPKPAATPSAPTTTSHTKRAPKTGHPIIPKKPVTTATAPATTKPTTPKPAATPSTPTTTSHTKRAPKTGHPIIPKKPVTTVPAHP